MNAFICQHGEYRYALAIIFARFYIPREHTIITYERTHKRVNIREKNVTLPYISIHEDKVRFKYDFYPV